MTTPIKPSKELLERKKQVEEDKAVQWTWNLDDTVENSDWLRGLGWDLPTDPDAFLRAIGGRERLDHFMTLPAARAMPQPLRQALGVIEGTLTVLTPDEVAGLDTLRKPQS